MTELCLFTMGLNGLNFHEAPIARKDKEGGKTMDIALRQFQITLMASTLVIGWLFLGLAISAVVILIKRMMFR